MSRTYRIVSALLIPAVVLGIGYYAHQRYHARRMGLLSQRIEHDGNAWKARFTARIAAPEQSVFDAIRDVGHGGHPGDVKGLRVLSDSGNRKTVEMELAGPAGQTIVTRLAFQYFPSEHRITYRTLGSGDFMTRAEYQLEPEGSSTLIRFQEVTTIRQAMPVPDGLIKDVIRNVFLAQLKGLRRKLHIRSAESSDEDEP